MLSMHSHLAESMKRHAMHKWWAFTPPVWCEFGGFSHYNFTVHHQFLRIRERIKISPWQRETCCCRVSASLAGKNPPANH